MNDIVIKHLEEICCLHVKLIEESISILKAEEAYYHQSDQENAQEIMPLK